MLEFRELQPSEILSIGNIDRSEQISQQYFLHGKELKVKFVEYRVSGFDLLDLEKLIGNQLDMLDANGSVVGCFEFDKIVGVVSVDARLFGAFNQFSKMDILYVDANYRKRGIGQKLVVMAKHKALSFGASKLYISATPTKQTVDFYLNLGACILTSPIEQLYRLEPEDIHLELEIPSTD